MDPVILTRVCRDDFAIFRIWIEYYKRRYTDIRCCIFRRPNEEIEEIVNFCSQRDVRFVVHESDVFDNTPTFEALRDLTQDAIGSTCLVVDCDEFVNSFDKLDAAIRSMSTDSILLKMVDRVSYNIFYDISRCETYEDLCARAPLKFDLTSKYQDWADEKCCINKLPDLGALHYPSKGKSSIQMDEIYLDHFKWRDVWLEKAKRRVSEVASLGYNWEAGLRKILDLLDGKPRGYLTIDGYFDYDNIFEEQCRQLNNGSVLVEVGIWKGRSISYLAECAKMHGKQFSIYGVDLFEERSSTLKLWEDCSYRDTRNNLEWRGLGEYVTLIKKSSVEAALYFPDKSVDFVWLDADHNLESVMMDISAWWPKIKTGGTIGGHDLPFHDVADALEKLGINYVQDRTSWIVRNMPEDRMLTWVRR